MFNAHTVAVPASLMKVGLEVLPVFGSDALGWSMYAEDFREKVPAGALCESLDELFFVLVNMNFSREGLA